MKITVTSTSTDVKSLIQTAWYDFSIIEANRIKDKSSNNSFWVYIKNIWASSIFLENFFNASLTTSIEIISWGDFSLDVYELSKLNLITATTNDLKLIIT